MAEQTDIAELLLDAADSIDDIDRGELQVRLRMAALTIRNLRKLVGIRAELELEDAEPEGHA